MKKPNQPIFLIAAVASVMLFQSCYQYRMIPNNVTPANEVRDTTVYSYLWGAYEHTIQPADCHGNGLTNVKVKTNFGFVLISAITLGIVVPLKIEWQCANDNCP
jgi:hypothetical protein